MSEPASPGDRNDLAPMIRDTAEAGRSLCALLDREIALIEAGRYGALSGLVAEKETRVLSFARCAADLQLAGWKAVLAHPDAAALVDGVTRLAEAIRIDLCALQRALVAADRVARVLGSAQPGARSPGYGPSGDVGAVPRGAIALDDTV